MYSLLNTHSEYTSFCISKNITSNTFLLVSKIVEGLQCILQAPLKKESWDWIIESWKEQIWKNNCIIFNNFWGMSVSWLAFAESKLKFLKKICSLSKCGKEEREPCFLLHTSPILSMIFYNGFNNWIIDAIWNRVAVSIFWNFKVAYNIGEEGIKNLRCIDITFNDFILFN